MALAYVVFFAIACLVQLAFGIALVRRGVSHAGRIAGVLFLANGAGAGLLAYQNAHDTFGLPGIPGSLPGWINDTGDLVTAGLLALLACEYPRRLRAMRWPTWLDWPMALLPAATFVAIGLAKGLSRPDYGLPDSPTTIALVFRFTMPAVPWLILLPRWTLLVARPDRGVPGRQFALVLCAFGIRAIQMSLLTPATYIARAVHPAPGNLPNAAWAGFAGYATALCAIAAIAIVARQASRSVPHARLVLAFLVAGVIEACISFAPTLGAQFGTPTVQTDLMVVRPVVLWLAVGGEGFATTAWRARRWQAIPLLVLSAAALAVFLDSFLTGAVPSDAWRFTLAAVVSAAAAAAASSALNPVAPWRRRALLSQQVAPWAPGTLVARTYRIQRLVHSGPDGRLYAATDTRTQTPVALKHAPTSDPRAGDALAQEARALSRVRHANLERLVAVAEEDGVVLVLDGPLATDLAGRTKRRLPAGEVLAVGEGILGGLQALHDAGLAHRDVRPATVVRDDAGTVRLAGLGASGPVRQARTAPHAATPDPAALRYRAPEQLHGRPGNARTDVYAAALLMAECLTGRHPIPEGLAYDEAVRLIEGGLNPALPASVPASVRLAILVGLDPNPERRWASAEAFRRALRSAHDAKPTRTAADA